MRTLEISGCGRSVLFRAARGASAIASPGGALDQVVSKVTSREKQEMAMIRQHSPLVETYIQKVRITESDGSWVPDGDHYFIGRAEFAKGLDLKPLPTPGDASVHHMVASMTHLFDFGTEFLPDGFLQMIYLDNSGLDTQNYNFDYVRREFLGEVRTLVFDVTPNKKASKGRFIGRIWVEDQDFTIVRFNGSYTGRTFTNLNFHFDSWRVNAGPNLWLPAFIYSEESTSANPIVKAPTYKAQTRLWGYDAGRSRQEQELSQVLIESASPVIDQSKTNNDLAPVQEAARVGRAGGGQRHGEAATIRPRRAERRDRQGFANGREQSGSHEQPRHRTRNSMPRADDVHHRIFFDGAYHRAEPRIDRCSAG